jgi:hypothetical protein
MKYSLNGVESSNPGTIRLKTTRASWRDSVTSMSVEFGHTVDRHSFRRHSELKRRDSALGITVTQSNSQPASATGTTITTESSSSSQASTTTVSSVSTVLSQPAFNVTIPTDLAPFPSDKPLHFNLTFQKLDQVIDLPALPPPAPQSDLNITLGCKNCTTSGSLDLVGGSFVVQPNNILGMGDVIQNGSVSLMMVDGFQAHIELGANITAQGALDIPLFQVPVQGFTIPGIGQAGLTFSTGVSAEFDISNALQVGFGFEVNVSNCCFGFEDIANSYKVPQNSSVFVNLANITDSSITGL